MVRTLYQELLDSWNKRDAHAYAKLFVEHGEVIGFDGSQMIGPGEITSTLQQVFADHITAAYVSKIRSVRLLSPEIALLRAIVGMIPPGQLELNPAVNAHQTVLAVKQADLWRIQLFQNTPAQFHGRPDLVQQMTEELRQALQEETQF
ncbi:SgcJ/EcaC family oxidoreductase [Ktedonosporobacter rubrisoli]|uniref:SgcJ/EcaC family oxidoreductase n=2 Tax=Ktedonosporobacter rubrisoli TaxID=2509675 RepID=A0A4P6K5K2_KTERU|nr:SgcJ/EcaC family oxidoreductase [Ktedonosporobacter rubrisoli]